jgi:hypothetical protein
MTFNDCMTRLREIFPDPKRISLTYERDFSFTTNDFDPPSVRAVFVFFDDAKQAHYSEVFSGASYQEVIELAIGKRKAISAAGFPNDDAAPGDGQ